MGKTDYGVKCASIFGGGVALGLGGLLLYDALFYRDPDFEAWVVQIIGGAAACLMALVGFWAAWRFGNAEKPAAPSDEKERLERIRQAFHESPVMAGVSGEEGHSVCIYRTIGFAAMAVFLGLSFIALRMEAYSALSGMSLFGAAVFFFIGVGALIFGWVENKDRESPRGPVSLRAGGDLFVNRQTTASFETVAPQQDIRSDALPPVQANYTIKDRTILEACGPYKPETIDGLGRFVMDDRRDYSGVNFLFTGTKIAALIAAAGGLLLLAPNLARFAKYALVFDFFGKIIAGMGVFFFVAFGLMHLVFVKGRLGFRLEIDKSGGTVSFHTYWFAFHFKSNYALRAFDHIFVTRVKLVFTDSQNHIESEIRFQVYLAGKDLLGIVYFDTNEKTQAFAAKLARYLDLPVKVNVDEETVL